jgi:hypothetical protein
LPSINRLVQSIAPCHCFSLPQFRSAGMIQWVAQTFELGDALVDARAAILTDL